MSSITVVDYKKVRDLANKNYITHEDYVAIETRDGTRKIPFDEFASCIKKNQFFDTAADLKAGDSLKEGDIVYTLGNRTANDGGGATYRIIYLPGRLADDMTTLKLACNDMLVAELVIGEYIKVEQLGAVGDGVNDDSQYIIKAMQLEVPVYFGSNKIYRVTAEIPVYKNQEIHFNGCTIAPEYCSAIAVGNRSNILLENFKIKANMGYGININGQSNNIHIRNFEIEYPKNYGINLVDCSNVTIEDGTINGGDNGIVISGSTSYTDKYIPIKRNISIKNVEFSNAVMGIKISSASLVSNLNIENCVFILDKSSNSSTAIYIMNKLDSASIINCNCIYGAKFLSIESGSYGDINVSGLNIKATKTCYDFKARDVSLFLSGIQRFETDDSQTGPFFVFNNFVGNMHLYTDAINIVGRYVGLNLNGSITGVLHDAKCIDSINIEDIEPVDIINSNIVYTCNKFYNHYINIRGGNNLTNITGGVYGQVIYIKSTENLSVANSNIIALADGATSVRLSSFKYIKLMKTKDNKWTQVL